MSKARLQRATRDVGPAPRVLKTVESATRPCRRVAGATIREEIAPTPRNSTPTRQQLSPSRRRDGREGGPASLSEKHFRHHRRFAAAPITAPRSCRLSQGGSGSDKQAGQPKRTCGLVHGMLELHGERDQPHTLWISARAEIARRA